MKSEKLRLKIGEMQRELQSAFQNIQLPRKLGVVIFGLVIAGVGLAFSDEISTFAAALFVENKSAVICAIITTVMSIYIILGFQLYTRILRAAAILSTFAGLFGFIFPELYLILLDQYIFSHLGEASSKEMVFFRSILSTPMIVVILSFVIGIFAEMVSGLVTPPIAISTKTK